MSLKPRHWPIGPRTCICGDRFQSAPEHMRHAQAYVAAWKGIKFTPVGEGREAFVPGHHMQFGLSAFPQYHRFSCSCGFAVLTAHETPQTHARAHIRAVVERIIDRGVTNWPIPSI